jgi:hypothetical protein
MYAIVYTWSDGRREVRYLRPVTDLAVARLYHMYARWARVHNRIWNYSIERGSEWTV